MVELFENEGNATGEGYEDKVCLHLMRLANDIAMHLDHKTAFAAHVDFLSNAARDQNCQMALYFLEKAKESFFFEIEEPLSS